MNLEDGDTGGNSMENLVRCRDNDVWIDTLNRPFKFHSPYLGDDFVLLLVVNDTTITEGERAELSAEIVRQGCRFAVATGDKCSTWDDAIDWAFLGTDPNFNPPEDRFVMTTWHENDPIEEVVKFFRLSTAFGDYTPKNFLVILLGQNRIIENKTTRELEQCF